VDSKAKKQEVKDSTPEATPTAAELQMTQAVEPSNAANTVRSTDTAVEQSQANLEAASSMPQVEADSPSASQDQAAMQDAPVEAAAAADDDEKILATGVAPSESVAAADPEASVSDTTEAALEVARDAPEEVATLPPDELIEEDRSFKHAPIERFNVDLETQRKFVSAVRQDVVSSRAHSEDEADEPLDNEDDSRENVRSQREDKKSDDKKDKIKSKDKDKMEKLDKVEKVDKVKETKSKYKKPANDDPVQEYEEPTKDKRSPTDVDEEEKNLAVRIKRSTTDENSGDAQVFLLLPDHHPVVVNDESTLSHSLVPKEAIFTLLPDHHPVVVNGESTLSHLVPTDAKFTLVPDHHPVVVDGESTSSHLVEGGAVKVKRSAPDANSGGAQVFLLLPDHHPVVVDGESTLSQLVPKGATFTLVPDHHPVVVDGESTLSHLVPTDAKVAPANSELMGPAAADSQHVAEKRSLSDEKVDEDETTSTTESALVEGSENERGAQVFSLLPDNYPVVFNGEPTLSHLIPSDVASVAEDGAKVDENNSAVKVLSDEKVADAVDKDAVIGDDNAASSN